MQAGNSGERGRKNDTTSPEGDQLQQNECDVASDKFKKSWLKLKEVHNKELRRLQTKMMCMREERLADKRETDSTTKINELSTQYETLNSTISDLRNQLSAKTCDRCVINETYKNVLQKEMYNMQQLNLKFISGLSAEISKLRGEIQKFSTKIKSGQQQFCVYNSDSDDDDYIPCNRKTKSVFDVRDPTQMTQVHRAIKPVKGKNTEQVKSRSKMELGQSLKTPVSSRSNVTEVPETSFVKTRSKDVKPPTEGNTCQKSFVGFPIIPSVDTQKKFELSCVTDFPGNKNGPQKRKHETNASQTPSTQMCEQTKLFLSLFGIPEKDITPTQSMSETSEENMPDNNRHLSPFPRNKNEMVCLSVLPSDSTPKSSEKERSTLVTSPTNSESSRRGGNMERPPNAQVALQNNESTCARDSGVTKPQKDSLGVHKKPAPKRKAYSKSQKK